MASLSQLFRFKKQLSIKDPRTEEEKIKIWIRLLGDDDLKESYKVARLSSSKKREILRDTSSEDYALMIAEIQGFEDTDLRSLIIAERENQFINEAPIVVTREDLPEIEEIAVEPDAPTLEEQEKLDIKTKALDKVFLDNINSYVETKKKELLTELEGLSHEALFEMAKTTMTNVQPLQVFAEELNYQKGYRGSYMDKDCKIKAFDSVEDFKDSDSSVIQQIVNAYASLELSPDDLKA